MKEIFNNIPLLLKSQAPLEESVKNGVILLYHGYTSYKEANENELDLLSSLGFLAIGVDHLHHGERYNEDFFKQMNQAPTKKIKDKIFLDSVVATSNEIPGLIKILKQKFPIKKIAISGISQGAYVVYHALSHFKSFDTAVAMIGNPLWENHPENPYTPLIKDPPSSLLSLIAENDDVVPPKGAKKLHEKLIHSPNIRLHEIKNEGHFMSEEAWNTSWKLIGEWFKASLSHTA